MPVVIDEMTVQVEVNQASTAPREPGQSTNGPQGNPESALIRKCVEEVMEVIRHQNER